MASSPIIMAAVRLNDELSPALKKLVENIEQSLKIASDAYLPLMERGKQAQEEFKMLGAVIKESLNVQVPREFSTALGSARREMNRLKTATEETHRSAHGLRETFKSLAETAKLFAGIEVPRLTKEAAVEGAELDRQRNMLQLMRLPPEALKVVNSAANTAAVNDPLMSKTKFFETYRDIAGVMPLTEEQKARGQVFNVEGATALTETWARATSALEAFGAKADPKDLRNLLSVGEHMVNMSPEFLSKVVDSYVRASQSEGSLANSASFRDLMTNMKAAGISISEDFMLKTVPVLMTTNNPSRLGNELSQLSKMLTGTSMTKQQAQWLVDHHLASQSQMEKMGSGPNNYRIKWGMADVAAAQSNPLQWAINKFEPALEHAVKQADVDKLMAAARSRGETLTEEKARSQLIAADIQRSGFRSSITDIDTHLAEAIPLIEQGMRRLAAMPGLEAGNESPDAVRGWKELTTSIGNFAAVLTSAPMHDAGQTLHDWAKWFGSISRRADEWAEAHPGWFDKEYGLGAKGVAAGVLGAGAVSSVYLFTALFGNTAATTANTAAVAANTAALRGGLLAQPGSKGVVPGLLGTVGRIVGRAAALGSAFELGKAVADEAAEGPVTPTGVATRAIANTAVDIGGLFGLTPEQMADNAIAHLREKHAAAKTSDLDLPASMKGPDPYLAEIRRERKTADLDLPESSAARFSLTDDAWEEKMRLARENYAQAAPVPVNVTPTGSGTITLDVKVNASGQLSVTASGPAKVNLNVGDQGKGIGDTLSRRREE